MKLFGFGKREYKVKILYISQYADLFIRLNPDYGTLAIQNAGLLRTELEYRFQDFALFEMNFAIFTEHLLYTMIMGKGICKWT